VQGILLYGGAHPLCLPSLMCLSLLLAAGCHPPHEPQSWPTPPRSGSAAPHRPRHRVPRESHRPVLLFWGAQWCPFRHTLKATVFRRSDFIAETRLFVPVYLDGDDPGAQQWGERFGVRGYPTLVLLDSEQHEIMRLGAGRDVSQYAAVLGLALEQLQPIDVLLRSAAPVRPAPRCRRCGHAAPARAGCDGFLMPRAA